MHAFVMKPLTPTSRSRNGTLESTLGLSATSRIESSTRRSRRDTSIGPDARQIHVEHHNVRTVGLDQLDSFLPIGCDTN